MPGVENYTSVSGAAVFGRQLPYSQEAEEAVIGSILLDPENCMPKAAELLTPECFYRPQHQQLFSIFMRKFSTGVTNDVLLVIEDAVTEGIFETSAMAKTYLMGLMNNVTSTANIASYCKIIADKAQIRSLINAANDILETAAENAVDPQTMLDSAEQKIYDIRQGKQVGGLAKITDVIVEAFQHLSEISGDEAREHLGATTGFNQLDHVIGGLNRSDFIVLAARPAMGKSALALNIAVNSCKSTKRDAVIFNLEMSKEQLVSRMLAFEAKVNNNNMRTGKLTPDDWDKLAEAADVLSQLPIYIDDTAGVTVPQMKAQLRRMRNLGLVVVDYIQLMQSPNKRSSRVNEVSEITRQLKLMAKELNVPVLALSQLSRNAEKHDDKRPLMSDLRESGSIEQDADIIMFIHRDSYYNETEENKSLAECIVAKNRHGSTGTINLGWMGEYTLFRGLDFRKDEG